MTQPGGLLLWKPPTEQAMTDVKDDLRDLSAAIHGPPRDGSIRGRVHKLENDHLAADAAATALSAAREIRENRWTAGQQRLAVLLAVIVAVSPWVQPFIHY